MLITFKKYIYFANQHYYDRKMIQTWGDSYSGVGIKERF